MISIHEGSRDLFPPPQLIKWMGVSLPKQQTPTTNPTNHNHCNHVPSSPGNQSSSLLPPPPVAHPAPALAFPTSGSLHSASSYVRPAKRMKNLSLEAMPNYHIPSQTGTLKTWAPLDGPTPTKKAGRKCTSTWRDKYKK